ncbi:MAG: hypothetical protein ABJF10_24640 [Chthoniobacter sp.]|uniref:capsular polysaccharide export protein, LipB/KpsS family n=1 Tax=Chthoniobacter sp. TaxID=2510640 RepID=UPI0032A55AD7
MIVPDTYCWTNPYTNGWMDHFYGRHFRNLYGGRIFTEFEFYELLMTREERPEIMLKWCFDADRAGMVSLCREHGINVTFCEDGFFPHYSTMHADPLGFCWESSLTRMVFRGVTDAQRKRARTARTAWLEKRDKELPDAVQAPFVLWPLQLVRDQVNHWDLHVSDWCELLAHFRSILPEEFQLVLKRHPLARDADLVGLEALVPTLPNTVLLPEGADLTTLLRAAHAVAGVNSSVLYEARLMHHKPTYAYGRSWFTNHTDLFLPVPRHMKRPLPRLDWLAEPARMRMEWLDDYTDWFLAQLLVRQFDHQFAEKQPVELKKKVWHLSWQSYREHGEAIFD